jgi:hypothetical protein
VGCWHDEAFVTGLEVALTELAVRLEAAGLAFGPFTVDGSSDARQVVIGPVDPDHDRNTTIMLGWDYRFPVGQPTLKPPLTTPTPRNVNLTAGTLQLEPALEYAERVVQLNLYMRELRPDQQRTGYNLNTAYMRNEERILTALGRTRREWQVNVPVVPATIPPSAIARGFVTRFEGNPFINTGQIGGGLTVHSVFRFRLCYPVLAGVELKPGFVARRVYIGHDRTPDTIPTGAAPNTPPITGAVRIVERSNP